MNVFTSPMWFWCLPSLFSVGSNQNSTFFSERTYSTWLRPSDGAVWNRGNRHFVLNVSLERTALFHAHASTWSVVLVPRACWPDFSATSSSRSGMTSLKQSTNRLTSFFESPNLIGICEMSVNIRSSNLSLLLSFGKSRCWNKNRGPLSKSFDFR